MVCPTWGLSLYIFSRYCNGLCGISTLWCLDLSLKVKLRESISRSLPLFIATLPVINNPTLVTAGAVWLRSQHTRPPKTKPVGWNKVQAVRLLLTTARKLGAMADSASSALRHCLTDVVSRLTLPSLEGAGVIIWSPSRWSEKKTLLMMVWIRVPFQLKWLWCSKNSWRPQGLANNRFYLLNLN